MERGLELWAMRTPEAGTTAAQARRAEQAGWDGITFTDSQNLVADPFVGAALAAAATEKLRFATGVSNLHTRHPAVLAATAATVQAESGGRFVLGIGRGDTALFHLGRKPMPVVRFAERLRAVQAYLAGDTIDAEGHPSRLHWLDRLEQPDRSGQPDRGARGDQPGRADQGDRADRGRRSGADKVPLDVACSGPRMLALAAEVAENVTLAVGADDQRVAWAIDLVRKAAADAGRDPDTISVGAYLNVGCHPDPDVARGLIAGGVAAFAHFSAMPASTGAGLREEDKAVVAEVGRRYDSRVHLRNDAAHTGALDAAFVDRFAVVGTPERCVERLAALAELGVDRFVITGPSFGGNRDDARTAERLLAREVLPALRDRPHHPTEPAPERGAGFAPLSGAGSSEARER